MKNFKRFVKAACYTSDSRNDLNRYDVPTWNEYLDHNERVSNYLEELSSRIAALENKKEDVKDCPVEEKEQLKSGIKTFVSSDYQITFDDKGGFEASVSPALFCITRIIYNPNDREEPWFVRRENTAGIFYCNESQFLSGLRLVKEELELLHKALEVAGKQDLMDDEIVFVENE